MREMDGKASTKPVHGLTDRCQKHVIEKERDEDDEQEQCT